MIATEQSEHQFRTLLGKLPAGAYTCDTGGLITFYNRSAADIRGREPQLNNPADRYCGSYCLYSTSGTRVPP